MTVENTEKKPMQTKNKVLIGVVSALVVVGVALGIYFGTKSNGDNNTGNATNDKSLGGLPTPTTTASGAGPSPTPTGVVPAHGNGTMINGTLFPYYTLTGEAPAPVGVPGMVYTTCKTPGTFSISFDDGPSIVSVSFVQVEVAPRKHSLVLTHMLNNTATSTPHTTPNHN